MMFNDRTFIKSLLKSCTLNTNSSSILCNRIYWLVLPIILLSWLNFSKNFVNDLIPKDKWLKSWQIDKNQKIGDTHLQNSKYVCYELPTVYPKAAKRFIPCAIWLHIAPLHWLNYSTVIAAAAELLPITKKVFWQNEKTCRVNVASKSRTRE